MSNTISAVRYRPSVRIGNWFEDICLEEDEIKEFLSKRKKKDLLIEKTRLLFLSFHAEIELNAPSDHIVFGAVAQILSCGMKKCQGESNVRSALSVIINERVVRRSQKMNDECEITIAPTLNPCVRNSFVIISGDDKDRTNELLKYGQNFALKCVDAEEHPLLLFSMQKSPDLTTISRTTFDSRKRGEINLPVGLCLKKNTGPGKDIPTAYTRWKCSHVDPKMRFETNGHPIPSNTPLIITHSATNRNLAAENIVVQTLFGPEFLVSVQNYSDVFKRESPRNQWIIAIGNEHKFSEES